MKRLALMTLLAVMTACAGCESTPEAPTTIPSIPAPVTPETKPAEPVAKFVIGDAVTIVSADGKTTVEGVVADVGPMAVWQNTDTKEEITSRAYLIRAMIDGKVSMGVVPEFALIRQRAINEKR